MQSENKEELSFLVIINFSLMLMMIGFNVWNWYLACSGITTVEFTKRFHLANENVYDYSYNSVADNLFVIFGTHKFIRILSPSIRALPFSGIEFSFQQKEAGYDENGVIWNDSSDDEEAPRVQEVQMTGVRTEQHKTGSLIVEPENCPETAI